MYDEYIEKLIDVLKHTQFCKNCGTERLVSYEKGMQELINCFTWIKTNGQQVFFIGNGGSAAIASHMTADYMKNGGLKTYSLYDQAVTTCMGNDYGYDYVFSRPLEFLCNENDLLIAISSSGNSQNIINAIETAKRRGAKTLTLSGFDMDNTIRTMSDFSIYVPVSHYGMVESIHNLILQQIVDEIMKRDGVRL